MKKIQLAVLITCHNRKEKTINCLNELFSQLGKNIEFMIDVFLVDDDSSDGTALEVQEKFPDVNIIKGNGKLFWNRGMFKAWKSAFELGIYDGYVWLNDDTDILPNTLLSLKDYISINAILVGSTKSIKNNQITYGAYDKSGCLINPNSKIQKCHYFNGNFVYVPHSIASKIGLLDEHFHHALGDIEYGFRANSNGFESFVLPDFVGYCESHDRLPEWRNPKNNILKRLKSLYTPISGCNPKEYFYFDRKYKGISIAIWHVITIHARAILPKTFTYVRSLR